MPDASRPPSGARVELYLVRHAIAAERGAEWPDDTRRPLTARGKSSFIEAVAGLEARGVDVDEILTSPLTRARQTAELLARGLARHPSVRVLALLAPGHAPANVLREIARRSPHGRLALVGHEPDLGELAAFLVGRRDAIPFKKGGACRIDVAIGRSGHAGSLVWVAPPGRLRAMARRGRVSYRCATVRPLRRGPWPQPESPPPDTAGNTRNTAMSKSETTHPGQAKADAQAAERRFDAAAAEADAAVERSRQAKAKLKAAKKAAKKASKLARKARRAAEAARKAFARAASRAATSDDRARKATKKSKDKSKADDGRTAAKPLAKKAADKSPTTAKTRKKRSVKKPAATRAQARVKPASPAGTGSESVTPESFSLGEADI